MTRREGDRRTAATPSPLAALQPDVMSAIERADAALPSPSSLAWKPARPTACIFAMPELRCTACRRDRDITTSARTGRTSELVYRITMTGRNTFYQLVKAVSSASR